MALLALKNRNTLCQPTIWWDGGNTKKRQREIRHSGSAARVTPRHCAFVCRAFVCVVVV